MVRYILGLVLLSNILVFGQNDFKDIESKIIEIKESNIREEYKIILFKEILYKQKLPTPDLVKGLVFHRIGASFRALSKYDSAQLYTQQAILYKSKVLPKNDIEIIKIIMLLNEFDVIKGNKISEIKLLTVFDMLNITPPENLYIEGYEII